MTWAKDCGISAIPAPLTTRSDSGRGTPGLGTMVGPAELVAAMTAIGLLQMAHALAGAADMQC